MLGGNGRYALYRRRDATLLTILANLQVLLFHIAALGLQHETGNLEIAESGALHLQQEFVGNLLELVVCLQLMLQVNDVLQALQEPHVDLGQFLNALYGITLFQSLGNRKDTQVGGVCQSVVQVVELRVVVAHETVHALTNHSQTLLDHLFERTADGHNLADRLHRRANLTAHTHEFGQVPTRNLADHIVEARSNVGT